MMGDGKEPETWPPADCRDLTGYHWLRSDRQGSPALVMWYVDGSGGRWYAYGYAGSHTPRQMAESGWEYQEPAVMQRSGGRERGG